MGHPRYRFILATANLSVVANLELGLLCEQQPSGLMSWQQELGQESSFTSDSGQRSSDCSIDILAAIQPSKQLIQVTRTVNSYAAERDLLQAKTRKPFHTRSTGFSKQNQTVLLRVASTVREELARRQHHSNHSLALPAIVAEGQRENATWVPHQNKLNSKLSSQHHSGIQGAATIAVANSVLQQRQLWQGAGIRQQGQTWQHGRHTEDPPTHTQMRGIIVAAVIICVVLVIAWNRHAFTPHSSFDRGIRSPLQRGPRFGQMATRNLPQAAGTSPAVRTGAAAVRSGIPSRQGTLGKAKEQFPGLSAQVPTLPALRIPGDRVSRSPSTLPIAMDTTLQLCGELVVPTGKECCLFLPQIASSTMLEGGRLSINDVNGRPVFNVTCCPRGEQAGKCLVLRSAVDDFAFGYCQDAAEGRMLLDSLALCHHSGTQFGTLGPDKTGGFVMRAINGWTVSIQDDGQSRAKVIEVGSGRLLAVTEVGLNTTVQRMMRIGPAVDAGLMGLIMLSTDLLLYRLDNLERATRSASRERQ